MNHRPLSLLLFTFILHPPAQAALIPDPPQPYLPSGHGFDSAILFNPWNLWRNYIDVEPSFPDQKYLDDSVYYKRSGPTRDKLSNVMDQAGEKFNDISLLRFGKRGMQD